MVTKAAPRVVATDAEQEIIRCRACNRHMWHVRNNAPKWLCGYCDLSSMTKRVRRPRSKKFVDERYKFKYHELYDKVRWSSTTQELEEAASEVQGLLLTEPAEGSLELQEIIACGREVRHVMNGRRFDGGELDE